MQKLAVTDAVTDVRASPYSQAGVLKTLWRQHTEAFRRIHTGETHPV